MDKFVALPRTEILKPPFMTIEGNRNGTFVRFTHKEKAERYSGRDDQRCGRGVCRCSDSVLVKNYFAPDVKTSVAIKTEPSFRRSRCRLQTESSNLILALNVDWRYFCTRSVPFYNSLVEVRQQDAGRVNIVAAFINKAKGRSRVTDEKQLTVQAIAGVDLDKLGVHTTPTLILVDSAGKVLDSWRGELQPDGEREVFAVPICRTSRGLAQPLRQQTSKRPQIFSTNRRRSCRSAHKPNPRTILHTSSRCST